MDGCEGVKGATDIPDLCWIFYAGKSLNRLKLWRIQDLPDGEGVPTSEKGAKTYYLVIFFTENCMKMKEFVLGGGVGICSAPPCIRQ